MLDPGRICAEFRTEAFLTSAGMALANLPLVLLGRIAAGRLALRMIRFAAAGALAGIGLWMAYGALAMP